MIDDKPKNELLLKLKVVPNSRQFGVAGFDPQYNSLRVKVKSKPLKGNANKEILFELEKFFDSKIKIVSGQKSRHKIVLVEKNQKALDLLKKLPKA